MTPPSRVMIVEDDELVRSIHRQLVQATPGFQVVCAVGTLAQAELDLASTPLDLLVVDIYLPDGSGLEWVGRLPRTVHSPDVIMVTAANDLPTVKGALRAGVLDFLIKPFDRERLHGALQRHHQRRQTHGSYHLTQHSVDRLLRHDPMTHLPKGIDGATLQRMQDVLGQLPEALTAEQIGLHLGVSRITAWRYLEYLTDLGFVVVEVRYQATGRPQKRYRRN